MFYKKVLIGLLMVVVGLPATTIAGSITASLIQGKTPSEAVYILAEQIDTLGSKIGLIESNQQQIQEDLEVLMQENENLKEQLDQKADVVVPPTESPECLAIKEKIAAKEQERDLVIAPLEKQKATLETQLEVLVNAQIEYSSPNLDEYQKLDEEIAWHQKVKAEAEGIQSEIEGIETQVESIQQQYQETITDVIESSPMEGCILG